MDGGALHKLGKRVSFASTSDNSFGFYLLVCALEADRQVGRQADRRTDVACARAEKRLTKVHMRTVGGSLPSTLRG